MKKNVLVLAHIVFWILVIAVGLLPVITIKDPAVVKNMMIKEAFLNPFCATIFYVFYLYIGPVFLRKSRVFLFMGVFFAIVIAYTVLIMLWYPTVLISIIGKPEEPVDLVRWYASQFSYHFLYALWGTMFRFTIDWFISNQKRKDLEKQNVVSELALLRSQVNPHFLFNTLNNVHSYVGTEPEKASNGIIRLSEIMRYMLYEASAEKVSIGREIHHIKSLIDLQLLRVKDQDFVSLSISADNEETMIPPLLLVPFIENAFKHGRKNVESPGISIRLSLKDGDLQFEIRNYINPVPTYDSSQSGGFGLKNIKRRLELLYPGQYTLEINTVDDQFHVKLNLRP